MRQMAADDNAGSLSTDCTDLHRLRMQAAQRVWGWGRVFLICVNLWNLWMILVSLRSVVWQCAPQAGPLNGGMGARSGGDAGEVEISSLIRGRRRRRLWIW